jgi:hypothetical protein
MAGVRREIHVCSSPIADLNRMIDRILNQTPLSQQNVAAVGWPIDELEVTVAGTPRQSVALDDVMLVLVAYKNASNRSVRAGVSYERAPWQIRRKLIDLGNHRHALRTIAAR